MNWQLFFLNSIWKNITNTSAAVHRGRIELRAPGPECWASIYWFHHELAGLDLTALCLNFPIFACCCVLSHFSHVQLFATSWTVAHQAPLSMGFSRRVPEWVAMPASSGSFQPRDQTLVPCIAGIFFTIWATKEAHSLNKIKIMLFLWLWRKSNSSCYRVDSYEKHLPSTWNIIFNNKLFFPSFLGSTLQHVGS